MTRASKTDRIAMGAPAIGEEEITAVAQVLRSGQLREGPVTRAFEKQFAEAEGAAWGIATSSGTTALMMAYLTTLQPGEEVIVPGFGFIATASMVVASGCVPVFCDIDPTTFSITPEEIDRVAGPKTRAAVPVHLYGHPCPIEPLSLICREKGIRMIWDAAQAHGATYQGKGMGAFGDLACYSFYPSKNMTVGEGGMILGHDEALRTRLARLKDHGTETTYDHRSLGYNFRSTDIASAIGIEQLKKLPELNRRRRLNASRLTNQLSGLVGVRLPVEHEGSVPVYHQYTIVLDPERLTIDRAGFAAGLAELGVATGVHYPIPVYHQQALVDHGRGEELSVCLEMSRRVLSIPVHPMLTDADIDRVSAAVRDVHDGALR